MDSRTEKCKAQYEGKHYFTKDGIKEFIITNYNSAANIDIEFVESGYKKNTTLGNINKGITNPFDGKSPIAFEDNVKAMIGCYIRTNQGDLLKIIGGTKLQDMYYKFQDEFGYEGHTTIQNIRKGQILNPYHRNELGGYLGEGPYNRNDPFYNIWYSMLNRATGARAKYNSSNGNLYSDSAVCQEWLCYNTFASWYSENTSKLNPNYTYELNKDLLYPMYMNQTNGIKLYSPTTVVLIPSEFNLTLFNYKGSDQYAEIINEKANQYFKNNAISQKTYNAILSLIGNRHKTYIDFRGNTYNQQMYRIDGIIN